uniref:Tail tape measure protein n=1 Tax=viral metagenome TaxID=1070528 RepID=A0A6M3KE02_9ZZZZ
MPVKPIQFKASASGVENVSGKFGKVDKSLASMAKTALASVGAMYALKKAMDFAIAAKNAARDATEIRSKFDAVFKDMTVKANKMADNLADSFGLAGTTARKLLGDTADLLTGFGFAQEEALNFSIKTNQLAIDLASFTNYAGGAEGATSALVRAFTGEREALKSLGIVVSEEMVKIELTRLGKEKLTGQSLMQAKAEATLNIAYTQSKNAIGDYARTQDELANVERRRAEAQKELLEQIGNKFVPAFTKANIAATNFFRTLTETDLETTIRHFKELGVSTEALIRLERLKLSSELRDANEELGKAVYQYKDIESATSAIRDIEEKSTKNISDQLGLEEQILTKQIEIDTIIEESRKKIGMHVTIEKMKTIEQRKQRDLLEIQVNESKVNNRLSEEQIAIIVKNVNLLTEISALERDIESSKKAQVEGAAKVNAELTETAKITKEIIKDMGVMPSLFALLTAASEKFNKGIKPLELIDLEEQQSLFDTAAAQGKSSILLWIIEYKKGNEEYFRGAQEVTNQVGNLYGSLSEYQNQLIANDMNASIKAENDKYNAAKNALEKRYTVGGTITETGLKKIALLEQSHSDTVTNIKDEARLAEIASMKKLKPIKVAQAISNAALATISMLALQPPSWLNFVAAGLAATSGAIQIGTIAAQEYAAGGVVPGTGTRDTVPAMLTPGELILNAAQQSNLISGSGGITINVSGNLIATEEEADRFAKIIQERSRLGFNQIQVRA